MQDQAAVLFEFDEDGLLRHPQQWTEDMAEAIAMHDGLGPLTADHWKVIHALRSYHAEFGVAPAISHLCRTLGLDKHCGHDLFHTCMIAWRVAGLPNPGEEAKAYLRDM